MSDRYTQDPSGELIDHPSGEWVTYEAYAKLEALVASGSGVPIYYLDKIVELEAKLEKAESTEGEDDERNG